MSYSESMMNTVGAEGGHEQPTPPLQQLGAVPGTTDVVLGERNTEPEDALEFASSGEAEYAPRDGDDYDRELSEEDLEAIRVANAYGFVANGEPINDEGGIGEEGAISAQVTQGGVAEGIITTGENNNHNDVVVRHVGSNGAHPDASRVPPSAVLDQTPNQSSLHADG